MLNSGVEKLMQALLAGIKLKHEDTVHGKQWECQSK